MEILSDIPTGDLLRNLFRDSPTSTSGSPTPSLWASHSALFFCIALNTDLILHI